MFKKILVANRGEIACRVMRTAKRLGIRTVAVFSDADIRSLHVAQADEAFHIGPARSSESYLRIDKIIDACRASGAEAVHPGYGFLSENPDFADEVANAGLIFIGPPASAMRAMGLKDAAKSLMQQSGVPVVPGYHGQNQDAAFLANEAGKIGYPVLIKARAGGGGKGMRRVEKPQDFAAALESAKREAAASFGDDRCLIERYMSKPRHIEFQIFGDNHGNVIHLFERDCSLQRRHQKVIEEAPAPGMTPEIRRAIGDIAVRAAKAVGYSGAGTVEFVADVSRGLRADSIFFLEMNTRLQVEHPVTEAITGLDLVEWQLRVAAGEPLPLKQDGVRMTGWACEARIYSEDPANGFLPATGVLEHLDFPADDARVETGVRQGDHVTPFYDPLIAKLIAHGQTRDQALNNLRSALARCHIAGTVTNVQFLNALCSQAAVRTGDVDTGLIARDLDALARPQEPPASIQALAAIALLGLTTPQVGQDPWDTLTGWRHWSTARLFAPLEWNGQRRDVVVSINGKNSYTAQIGTSAVRLDVLECSDTGLRFCSDGRIASAKVVAHSQGLTIFCDGQAFTFTKPDDLDHLDDDAGKSGDIVVSPMPGLVKIVLTSPGARIVNGDPLVVVEAMKMEHTLTARRDGEIADVHVKAGDHVANGATLLTMKNADG